MSESSQDGIPQPQDDNTPVELPRGGDIAAAANVGMQTLGAEYYIVDSIGARSWWVDDREQAQIIRDQLDEEGAKYYTYWLNEEESKA